MFTYEKKLNIKENIIVFRYKIVTGEISCKKDNKLIFKQFLWLPYKKIKLVIGKEEYELKTILFPINKISMSKGDKIICSDLFPKLKRYTIISFTLSTIKKGAIILAFMFS